MFDLLMHCVPSNLQDYTTVSCTTHNFLDDNQTFSPQYDCKHMFYS